MAWKKIIDRQLLNTHEVRPTGLNGGFGFGMEIAAAFTPRDVYDPGDLAGVQKIPFLLDTGAEGDGRISRAAFDPLTLESHPDPCRFGIPYEELGLDHYDLIGFDGKSRGRLPICDGALWIFPGGDKPELTAPLRVPLARGLWVVDADEDVENGILGMRVFEMMGAKLELDMSDKRFSVSVLDKVTQQPETAHMLALESQ